MRKRFVNILVFIPFTILIILTVILPQVEELTNLKKIAEKQLEEALESLQAEREQRYHYHYHHHLLPLHHGGLHDDVNGDADAKNEIKVFMNVMMIMMII